MCPLSQPAPPQQPGIGRYASTDGNLDVGPSGAVTGSAAEAPTSEDAVFFDEVGHWRPEALQIVPWTSSTAATTRATLLTMLKNNASSMPLGVSSPPILDLPSSSKQRRFRAKTLGESAANKQAIAAIVAAGPPQAVLPVPTSSSAAHSPAGSVSPKSAEVGSSSRNTSGDGIAASGSGQLASIREDDDAVDHDGPVASRSGNLHVPGPSQPRALSPRVAGVPAHGVTQSEDRFGRSPGPSSISRDTSTELPRPSSPAGSSANRWMPSNMQASSAGPLSPRSVASPSAASVFSFRALRDRLRGSNPPSPASQPPSKASEVQPRTLRFLFSKATTSPRDAQQLILEVEQALLSAGVLFERTGFVFLCKASVRADPPPKRMDGLRKGC